MKDSLYPSVIIFVLLVLLALSYFRAPIKIYETRSYTDTIYSIDTVQLEGTVIKVPGKTVYDTTRELIPTFPFVACLDTVDPVTYDTIGIEYHYPINIFLYDLRRKPFEKETITIHKRDSIFVPQNIVKPWYEPYLSYGLVFATGYALGRIR